MGVLGNAKRTALRLYAWKRCGWDVRMDFAVPFAVKVRSTVLMKHGVGNGLWGDYYRSYGVIR